MSIISSRSSIWQLKDVQRGRLGAFYNLGTIPLEYILVAGGGAGGSTFYSQYSGGGGAGGYLTNESGTPYEAFTGVTYAITIGAGGTSPANTGATTGGNTIFNATSMTPGVSVTAFGGGGGGGFANAISFGTEIYGISGPGGITRNGGPGGSGGGGGPGWHWGVGGGTALGQISPAAFGPQGYPGGSAGAYGFDGGGGGGGASDRGNDLLYGTYPGPGHPFFGVGQSSYGGNGLTGFDGVARAGGGGGGTGASAPQVAQGVALGGTGNNPAGYGGAPGRSYSPTQDGRGAPGANGKGGGGGGNKGPSNTARPGGTGGSGCIVIRYPANYAAANFTTGGPSYQELSGYRIYTFTSSGTISF